MGLTPRPNKSDRAIARSGQSLLELQHITIMTHLPFPNKKYQIIYADPPWTYRDKAKAGNRGVEFKYPTLKLPQICALPVAEIAADDCLLAMWWVMPQPKEALAVVQSWGFTLKTMGGFTWHKQTKNEKSFMGMGSWTRCNPECCLFAVRGKPKRIDMGVRAFLEAPWRPRTAKPPEVRDRLVQLMGDLPRIELFATEYTEGWDVWGNEVTPPF